MARFRRKNTGHRANATFSFEGEGRDAAARKRRNKAEIAAQAEVVRTAGLCPVCKARKLILVRERERGVCTACEFDRGGVK